MLFLALQKRAAPGESAAGGAKGAVAKKAKPTAASAGGDAAEGGIEVDGVGVLTEAELAAWATTGQVSACPTSLPNMLF